MYEKDDSDDENTLPVPPLSVTENPIGVDTEALNDAHGVDTTLLTGLYNPFAITSSTSAVWIRLN